MSTHRWERYWWEWQECWLGIRETLNLNLVQSTQRRSITLL